MCVGEGGGEADIVSHKFRVQFVLVVLCGSIESTHEWNKVSIFFLNYSLFFLRKIIYILLMVQSLIFTVLSFYIW